MRLTINKKAVAPNLANLIFLILFPGFFFYSFAVATGVLPAFPGGWFGIFSVLSFAALLPFAFVKFLNSTGIVVEYLFPFFLFLVFIGLWAVIHYLMGTPLQQNPVVMKGSVQVVVFSFVFFFTGFFLHPNKWFMFFLCACLFGMIFIILINLDLSRMMFYAREQFALKEGVATYQGFARSFAVTAILLLSMYKRYYFQAFFTVISLIALYFLGARSEFFGFLFVVFVAGWIIMSRSSLTAKIFVFALFALFLVSVLGLRGGDLANRQLEVLKLTESSSVAKRIEFFKEGWSHISRSPVFGDYAGQLRDGGFGSYIHNGLSAWRQFGLLGFGMYFGLSALSFFIAARNVFFRKKNEVHWRMALLMNSYTLILIIAAKSIFGSLAPLGWGLTLNAIMQEKTTHFWLQIMPDTNVQNEIIST